jgi:hypothetical protein
MEMSFPERGFAFYRLLQDENLVRIRKSEQVTLREVDLRTSLSKTALLRAIGSALEVPDRSLANINYDALDEAIRDLSWIEFQSLVIVFIGCSAQWEHNYVPMSTVLEICADAHSFWQGQGKGLFVALVD